MSLFYDLSCRLCRVSFSVKRLYRPDELEDPEDILHLDCVYVSDDEDTKSLCEEDAGCEDTICCNLRKHIPGPSCASTLGYSGYRISAEEMEGCRDIQALVKKESDWSPEHDDQDFERETNFVLTGTGNNVLCPEEVEYIEPVRHGVDSLSIEWTSEDVSWILKATVSS